MQRDDALTCPICGTLFAGGTEPCPDPRAHERRRADAVHAGQVYGGQLRSAYRVDEDGRALIPFRRWDGEVREFACHVPGIDPVTGQRLPWLIAKPVLEGEDLYYVTNLSPSAFQGQSAAFPGRLPGTRRVIVETTTFLREYVFGSMVRRTRWRRTSRRQKKERHTRVCPAGCRKQHRAR
jgi:hypothetical protein